MSVQPFGFVFKDADQFLTSGVSAEIANTLIRNVFKNQAGIRETNETYTIEVHGSPLLNDNPFMQLRITSDTMTREEIKSHGQRLQHLKEEIESEVTRILTQRGK